MTRGSHSSVSEKKREFRYPFPKTWVYASTVMAGLAIAFATVILIEEPVSLLIYFMFVSLLTMAIVALKLHIYSMKEETSEGYLSKDEQMVQERHRRWRFVIVLCLTIAALFSPIVLAVVAEPLWSFIGISGFVPAATIPEILLYIYSQRSKNTK